MNEFPPPSGLRSVAFAVALLPAALPPTLPPRGVAPGMLEAAAFLSALLASDLDLASADLGVAVAGGAAPRLDGNEVMIRCSTPSFDCVTQPRGSAPADMATHARLTPFSVSRVSST